MKHESINNPGIDDPSWQEMNHENWINPGVINNYEEIKSLKPVEQLRFLSSAAEKAAADAHYAHFIAQDLFEDISNIDTCSPFAKIIAKNALHSIRANEYYTDDNDYIPVERYGYDIIVSPEMMPEGVQDPGLEQIKKYFRENQAKMHAEFPTLPEDKQLVRIASDAAATVEFQRRYDSDEDWFSFGSVFKEISSVDGRTFSDNEEDLATYLTIIHNNGDIKTLVEERLNLRLSEIPLESQVHLLRFMAEADNTRFNKLCATLGNLEDKKLKSGLLNNFVAVDFGEDFGDSLLTIAESKRLKDSEKENIFNNISSCRESINNIASLYAQIDNGEFTKEYARAANERLTDAVTVFREIADRGSIEVDLDWAGSSDFDYASATEALSFEAKSLEIISGTIGDIANGEKGCFAETVLPSAYYSQFTLYNLYSPNYGYVLLYTRPEGSSSFDDTLEYGKRGVGVEASVSFITNPKNPFELPKPFKPDRRKLKNLDYYDHSTMDKVSALRIDREGRAPDMTANDPERSPINHMGTISVDLAAINDRADTPSGKIARLFSVGNKLREDVSEGGFTLNHNTKWFEQEKYGTSEGFQRLVKYVDALAAKWCIEHKPNSSSELNFSRLMRQARGNKTRRAA